VTEVLCSGGDTLEQTDMKDVNTINRYTSGARRTLSSISWLPAAGAAPPIEASVVAVLVPGACIVLDLEFG
jgi:hypothetical protein